MRVIKESRPLARPKRFALVVACVLTCLAADEARAQVCGDGTVDGGESCDDGNTENGDCCSSTCTFEVAGTSCGDPSNPVCDNPDTCDGSGTCQANPEPGGTTVCRTVAGECDVEELCDGAGSCPAEVLEPASTVCRPSAGICDTPELCSGSSASCPADLFKPATLECRDTVGICDVPESCTGTSASCPADAFVPATTVCRSFAGICDVEEFCTGTSSTCPTDSFEPATLKCRDSQGVCDPEDFCTGSSASCPADAKSTGPCRPAAGPCDLAELCDGAADACPADVKSTAQCRASAGACDVPEFCDGINVTCPALDVLEPATTECRSRVNDCDVSEFCPGTSAACPSDGFELDDTPCDDLDECTIDDVCSTGICQGDSGPAGLATCGDGTRRSTCGEECDDGNLEDCDGCSSRCEVEAEACGAQSVDQQKCITDLNKNMVAVARARGKVISRCMKDAAKGRLIGLIDDCLTSDPRGKVAQAEAKTQLAEFTRCVFSPPGFGPRVADVVNEVVSRKEVDLAHSVFGTQLDTSIVTQADNKSGSKCQLSVEKALRKCRLMKLKQFTKCKKTGLKETSITDAASLRSTCVGADPKGRIAKACHPVSGKVRATILKHCLPGVVDLAQLFPSCSISDAEATATCLDQLVECHVCLALAEADDFGPAICDLADDGIENASCGEVEPAEIAAKCGPGPHWIDGPCDPGLSVLIGTTAFIGIDLGSDCLPDLSLTLSGDTVIERSGPLDLSSHFPGSTDCGGVSCGVADAHLDVIDTEIVSMSLTGGGVALRLGDDTSVPLPRSLGTLVEQGDPALAEGFFDFYIELEVGGLLLYNHSPVRVQADSSCVPPEATYLELTQCVPLFDRPIGGVQLGALVFVEYNTNRCGNNVAGDQEACDGTDDQACPGQCQADCTCP